jgi:hypothetical protein
VTPLLNVEQAMDILRTTVPKLKALVDGVPNDHLYGVTEYGWSVNEQLAHLRASHDVLGGNMLRIAREDHPAWKGAPGWRNQATYSELPFEENLAAFETQRAELLAVYEPMPLAAFERTATVTAPPNKVYENSALYYADWMARHERSHLRHIGRVLKDLAEAG